LFKSDEQGADYYSAKEKEELVKLFKSVNPGVIFLSCFPFLLAKKRGQRNLRL